MIFFVHIQVDRQTNRRTNTQANQQKDKQYYDIQEKF